jgi:predicted ATPase/DNA-binding SARP family transcriptional activator
MEFRILGPLEVWDADRRLPLGGAKQRAVVAILLLDANRVVSAERLVELLWGDEAPETVGNTLQVCISQLRKILEPAHVRGTPYQVLVSQERGYLIRVAAEEFDLRRFEQLREEASRASSDGRPDTAAATLREALALWRGPALADFATESYAIAECARLNELGLRALEDRIEADLALGRHADLVGELEALVATHPLRERLRAQLMLALYRSGRQAEASDVYHKTRAVLVEELGMEPGAELQKLLKAVLNQDPSLDPKPSIEVRPASRTNNLPLQLTRFVGRSDEIAEVTRLLSRNRLLTLTGAGGIGKTRLAIEVAAQQVGHYRDGVWLVELAPLGDPELVPQIVASALGIGRGARPPTESLTEYLKDRQLLLVLDNCEHLVDASARLAKLLLEASQELRILATSRESLGVQGEAAWRVPSLSEAVALFEDRAEMARGSFTLDDKTSPLVVELCARLDGIPLAIELAAARLTVLSLDRVVARLNDRFRLLSGGSRTALPRQQTLRNAIDWSYELLPESERALLRRLSVFAGGIGLDAAEAVCGETPVEGSDVLDLLGELVRKSLVLVYESGGEARYRLLETIREYGHDRLAEAGESEVIGRRHCGWYLSLAERAEPELRGPEQVKWSELLELDHDNLRAALAWTLQASRMEESLRLARALAWFWRMRGHITEGREWLSRALTLAKDNSALARLRAQVLVWTSVLAMDQGDSAQAALLAEESLAICRRIDDQWGIGFAMQTLGLIAVTQDEHERATRLLQESLTMFRAPRDNWSISRSLGLLGIEAHARGDYPTAMTMFTNALSLSRELGDSWHLASTLQNLGQVELSQSNFERASQLFEQTLTVLGGTGGKDQIAVVLYRLGIVARCREDYEGALGFEQRCLILAEELGDKQIEAYALGELGVIWQLVGNSDRASTVLKESLELLVGVGDRWCITKTLEAMGAVSVEREALPRAARLFGAAERLREDIGAPLEPYEQAAHQRRVAAVRAALGVAESEELWREGRAMSFEDAIAFGLEAAPARLPAGIL